MDRFFLHYGIHFLLPMAIGFLFFKENRTRAILVMLAAIAIDLDHLIATPIFDPQRCSINFHPLHSYWAMLIYGFFLLLKPLRIAGLGLMIHMLADGIDCLLMNP